MQSINRIIPRDCTMPLPDGGELAFYGSAYDGPIELMAWGKGFHSGVRVGSYSNPSDAVVAALAFQAGCLNGGM